jgi:hypothetical protein
MKSSRDAARAKLVGRVSQNAFLIAWAVVIQHKDHGSITWIGQGTLQDVSLTAKMAMDVADWLHVGKSFSIQVMIVVKSSAHGLIGRIV